MSEDNTPSQDPPPNPWVRWLVVGLPFGLLFMGALSFVFYFQKRNAARQIEPSRYSTMMRKDLNLEEYRRYLKVLGKDIGPRTPDQPGNIEAAQSFIQSTLGYDNMGYDVVRRELGRGVAFEAGLPASKAPEHLVLVCARYDGVHPEALAALFSLAHAFTGSTHRNSIRFFAFNDSGVATTGHDPASDAAIYSQWNTKEKFAEIATFYICNHGEKPESMGGNVMFPLQAPLADDPSALESLKQQQAEIAKYGDALLFK